MSLEKIQKVKNHLQVYATTCKKISNYKKNKQKKTTNKISFFLQVFKYMV